MTRKKENKDIGKQKPEQNPKVNQMENIIDSDSEFYKSSVNTKKEKTKKEVKTKLHFENLERYYHKLDKHTAIKRIGNKLFYDNEKNIELPYYDTVTKEVAKVYRQRGIIY